MFSFTNGVCQKKKNSLQYKTLFPKNTEENRFQAGQLLISTKWISLKHELGMSMFCTQWPSHKHRSHISATENVDFEGLEAILFYLWDVWVLIKRFCNDTLEWGSWSYQKSHMEPLQHCCKCYQLTGSFSKLSLKWV